MNLFEKEKYLKFCDKSVSKIPSTADGHSILRDFRYLMSFDPYNSFYMPIIAAAEDLQFWDGSGDSEDSASKEIFFKNCLLNFDEKSFAVLSKYNSHYVNEFISSTNGSVSA
jgi:hypothetical protein